DGLHAVFPGPLLYAGPVSRFRALLARTLGDPDAAAAKLAEARAACVAGRARPAELRVACELGELAAETGARGGGRALLAEAAAGAAAPGMGGRGARGAGVPRQR